MWWNDLARGKVHACDADPLVGENGTRHGGRHSDDLGVRRLVGENFGNLVSYLEAHDLLDETIIVVVGDHGEALGEHDEPTHATYVYDSTIRVPLLIAGPGVAAGRVEGQVVTNLDLFLTVLALAGVPGQIEGGLPIRRE